MRIIRADENISGFHMAKHEEKVTTFADSMLFFLTKPLQSLTILIHLFEKYTHISNMKINFLKFVTKQASPVGDSPEALTTSLPFAWTSTHFKYLVIHLPIYPSKLFELNFPPYSRKSKKNSVAGREYPSHG